MVVVFVSPSASLNFVCFVFFLCLFFWLSLSLSMNRSINQSINQSIYLSIYLSISIYAYIYIHTSLCLSATVSLVTCPSQCPSPSLTLFSYLSLTLLKSPALTLSHSLSPRLAYLESAGLYVVHVVMCLSKVLCSWVVSL